MSTDHTGEGKPSMPETFRIRVAARRQVTLPTRVLEILNVGEGDVLEISVDKNVICGGRGLKLMPASLFDDDLMQLLEKREREIAAGKSIKAKDTQELTAKVRRKAVHA